jgi:two-component system chemotaxis response regulator CheY
MAKTILVVDDSESVRKLVSIALMGAGYTVIEAVDGKDGLSKLSANKVNMIVSDVNMPIMDGITMLIEIKKLPMHKFTPILMLTTEAGADMKARGQAAGAKAWLVKPFQPAVLISAVSKLI